MPRLVRTVPKYQKHKASGQAIVTIGGHDHYLGPHGTHASKVEYDRLIQEWLAAGRPSGNWHPANDLTVSELIAEYWRFAKSYYRKDGQPTGEIQNIRDALRLIKRLYGPTRAVDFGPRGLKSLQKAMIDAGLARSTINFRIGKIKRMFKWGVSEELLPVAIAQALATVSGLRRGRTAARETPPIQPVDDATLNATLPYLPPVVADMVRFQRFTGCRPGEVCTIRPCDLETEERVWVYRPASHKTEHHGRERVIFIGPRAQKILQPYLLRPAEQFCFSPAEAAKKRLLARHEQRTTPLNHGNRPGTNRKRKPRRRAGDCYDNDSYRRAIHRACDTAFPPPPPLRQLDGETSRQWHDRLGEEQHQKLRQWQSGYRWSPNQLRHAAATEIRRRYGLEAAQVTLGHASADVTQIYAQRDWDLAAEVMMVIG